MIRGRVGLSSLLPYNDDSRTDAGVILHLTSTLWKVSVVFLENCVHKIPVEVLLLTDIFRTLTCYFFYATVPYRSEHIEVLGE